MGFDVGFDSLYAVFEFGVGVSAFVSCYFECLVFLCDCVVECVELCGCGFESCNGKLCIGRVVVGKYGKCVDDVFEVLGE